VTVLKIIYRFSSAVGCAAFRIHLTYDLHDFRANLKVHNRTKRAMYCVTGCLV
jgi:hypothetical protein